MSKVVWSSPICEFPCNVDGRCCCVEEYFEKGHAFCYGYSEKDNHELCPFHGLKEDTIIVVKEADEDEE